MASVPCAKCQHPLPTGHLVTGETVRCPSCRARQTVSLFPALSQDLGKPATSAPLFQGDAACYYDPDKRAVAVCDDCGRFISEFHRVVLSPQHTTCLSCLTAARNAKNRALTERERIAYDNLALAMAIIPPLTLVGLYFLVFTAPITLYIVVRYWKIGPNSIIPRGRYRFVIAAVIALLELGLVALFGWAIADSFN